MYKLIAFDAYGTLFDVYSMGELAETIFPVNGQAFASAWRDRQIEYTRLVTMSDPGPAGSRYYMSFWDITVSALRYVCKRMSLDLKSEQEKILMDHYAQLVSFGDAYSVLTTLKNQGLKTCILSNGNQDMLTRVVESNNLSACFDKIISVEKIRLFKTVPQAYELLLSEFTIQKNEILFVSSNAWDALAAQWFGFDVFWVNRHGHPFEEIGQPPLYEGKNLTDILHKISF